LSAREPSPPPAAPTAATTGAGRPEFPRGEGKLPGVAAVFLGWLGLGGVVALRFPALLSTPDLRGHYPMPLLRLTIDGALISALALGLVALLLGRRRSRGALALALGVLGLALGGSRVAVPAEIPPAPYLALDWFLLSLLVLALVFVPLERAFGRLRQRVFRPGWRTDLAHFGVSHLLVQVTVLLTMLPAALLFRWAVSDRLQAAVAAQPWALQLVEAVFVADLFAYVAHRLFHEVPVLWRFHAIHHSSEQLDWLASSRLHVVDVVVTRAFGFLPLYVLGFAPSAIYAYLTFASFHAIFIHSNLRFRFGWLRYLLATPQYHHWHHSATLRDRNFAVHLPVIDKLLGTFHLPGEAWPERYGIEGHPVPDGYLSQLVYPVRGGRRGAKPVAEDPPTLENG
jgi:lathosterol oxidase